MLGDCRYARQLICFGADLLPLGRIWDAESQRSVIDGMVTPRASHDDGYGHQPRVRYGA